MLSGSNARLILKGRRCGPGFPRAFHSRCERTLPPARMAHRATTGDLHRDFDPRASARCHESGKPVLWIAFVVTIGARQAE